MQKRNAKTQCKNGMQKRNAKTQRKNANEIVRVNAALGFCQRGCRSIKPK
jgi:hypothetical protein